MMIRRNSPAKRGTRGAQSRAESVYPWISTRGEPSRVPASMYASVSPSGRTAEVFCASNWSSSAGVTAVWARTATADMKTRAGSSRHRLRCRPRGAVAVLIVREPFLRLRGPALLTLAEPVAEPKPHGARTIDGHRLERNVLGEQLRPLVGQVRPVKLKSPGALGKTGRCVVGGERGIVKDLRRTLISLAQLIRRGIGASLASRRYLPERLVVSHRQVVAEPDAALERRAVRERRTESTEGVDDIDRLAGRGIHEVQRLHDFTAVPRGRRPDGQMLDRASDERGLQTLDPIGGPVGGKDQVTGHPRIKYRDLHFLPVFSVDRTIPLQPSSQPFCLPAQLVVDQSV